MNITVDLRSLEGNPWSGVPIYTRSLVQALVREYPMHQWNGYSNGRTVHPIMMRGLHSIQEDRASSIRRMMQWMLPWSSGMGDTPLDVLFIPNWNMAPARLRAPMVLTVHDLWVRRMGWDGTRKERLWHWMIRLKRLLNNTQRIICVSRSTEDELLFYYPHLQGRTRVVPLASPLPEPHECGEDCQWRGAIRPRLVIVGDSHGRKNIDYCLRALDAVSVAWEVVVVGVGERATTERGASRIHWMRALNPIQYHALLHHSTALVYGSLYEGFGFPAQEARSAGIAAIASSTPALLETIGSDAQLVNPLDWKELAFLLERPDRLKSLAKPSPPSMVRTWSQVATETVAVLNEAVHEDASINRY